MKWKISLFMHYKVLETGAFEAGIIPGHERENYTFESSEK
jgi:hypothetical protein